MVKFFVVLSRRTLVRRCYKRNLNGLNRFYFEKSYFLQQNEKIENLQRTVNAQAALISSQTEMLKEINKKLLENEQKLADFLHAKGVAASASKRPLPLPVMSPNLQDEDGGEPSTKKLKAA